MLVNIPDNDKRKHNFISYYVRISDLDTALAMISFISPNNPRLINRGLFVAALADLIKCFEGTDKYSILSERNLSNFAPDAYKEFRRYKALRNQHYMHVSNGMTEAFAFLPVAPEGSGNLFDGVPSVIVDSEELDYVKERGCLEWVIQETRRYAEYEFDKVADSIAADYKKKTREELLSYGIVKPIPASADIDIK